VPSQSKMMPSKVPSEAVRVKSPIVFERVAIGFPHHIAPLVRVTGEREGIALNP